MSKRTGEADANRGGRVSVGSVGRDLVGLPGEVPSPAVIEIVLDGVVIVLPGVR